MKRIPTGNIGIAQGARVMFSDFVDGGMMWTGQGPRESRHVVTFDTLFLAVPSVMASISMWDMDHNANSRADIQAEHVTATGFHLVFRTWGDSRVARVRAEWVAIGPVKDPDDWALD